PAAVMRSSRPPPPSLLAVATTYADPDRPSSRTVGASTGTRTAPSTTVLPSRCGTATSAPRASCAGLIVVAVTADEGAVTSVTTRAADATGASVRNRGRGRMSVLSSGFGSCSQDAPAGGKVAPG